MPNREEVREVVDGMAMKGLSAAAIGKELKKKSMGGVIGLILIVKPALSGEDL